MVRNMSDNTRRFCIRSPFPQNASTVSTRHIEPSGPASFNNVKIKVRGAFKESEGAKNNSAQAMRAEPQVMRAEPQVMRAEPQVRAIRAIRVVKNILNPGKGKGKGFPTPPSAAGLQTCQIFLGELSLLLSSR